MHTALHVGLGGLLTPDRNILFLTDEAMDTLHGEAAKPDNRAYFASPLHM